jgi:hypothetical protein
MLFGVSATDPLTFAGVTGFSLLVGQAGTYSSIQKWSHESIAMAMGGIPLNQIQSLAAVKE